MPIARINGNLVYFAHVPKCAGSAVEDYLAKRFGLLGFLDRDFLSLHKARSWYRSSPQHIPTEVLDRLLPPSFFAASFAFVRHPVDRMVSVFRFQRDVEGKISAKLSFEDWLDTLSFRRVWQPFHLDNHYRPMSDFVPEGAKIFRLEDGTGPMVHWLDELAGDSNGPRELAVSNTYDQRLDLKQSAAGPAFEVTGANRRKIEDFCRTDFERFGYAQKTET